MVACIDAKVTILGKPHNVGVDLMCIIDSLNKLKREDKDMYEELTESLSYLIKNDEDAKEVVMEFIENLHDIL